MLIDGDHTARCSETMNTDINSPTVAMLPILIAPNQILKARARYTLDRPDVSAAAP